MSIPHKVSISSIHRAVFAAGLGTVFEWYDFFIYGSMATLFGELFFPRETLIN
jgi:hypothetical protein